MYYNATINFYYKKSWFSFYRKPAFESCIILFYAFLPNGLFFAKSTNIGAATKIEE